MPMASSKSDAAGKSHLLVPKRSDLVGITRGAEVLPEEQSHAADQRSQPAREYQRVNGMNSTTIVVISPEAAREERSARAMRIDLVAHK